MNGWSGVAVRVVLGLMLVAGSILLFGARFNHVGPGMQLDWVTQGIHRIRFPLGFAIGLVGIGLMLMAMRSTRLRWLARNPSVQITTFGWTGPIEGTDTEGTWITSMFRDELSHLQLDALDALPERAPGAPLVEIFAGIGQGTSIGKFIAAAVRVVFPDCAYTVWGTLRPHDGENASGGHIAVELVDRSHREQTVISVTLQAEEWRVCTREAAMAIAGALYPRVRHHHQGPWTQWTQAVPSKLVMDYHDAVRYEREDRLEEAIGSYQKALERDPLNPQLRLCIAMVQERLGLYLDAWLEYQALTLETDRRAWKYYERRVRLVALYRLAIILGYEEAGKQWMRPEHKPRTQRDVERQTLRAELAQSIVEEPLFEIDRKPKGRRLDRADAAELWSGLRARLAEQFPENDRADGSARELIFALLCGGTPDDMWRRKPWQWKQHDPIRHNSSESSGTPTPREDYVNELLQILALRHLEELKAWLRPWPPRTDLARWLVRRPRLRVNELRQILALRDLEELKAWLRPWPPRTAFARWLVRRPRLRRSLLRREIAPDALELAFTCLRLRMRAIRWMTIESKKDGVAFDSLLSKPPFVRRHGDKVRVCRYRRPTWPGQRDDGWLTYYNAACTVAVPLIPKRRPDGAVERLDLPEGIEPELLVETAVAHLEHYAHSAGSHRVANQEGWIGAEDPDLAGLTISPTFQRWARHHLSKRLPERRPIRSVDVAHHLRTVLQNGADAMAMEWRMRARQDKVEADEAERWWRDEQKMWSVVLEACREFRSWPVRLRAIEAVNHHLRVTDRPQIESAPSWRARAHIGDPNHHERRLSKVAELVFSMSGSDASAPRHVLGWVDERREHIATRLDVGISETGDAWDVKDERKQALIASRLWGVVATALDPEKDRRKVGIPADPRFQDLERAVGQLGTAVENAGSHDSPGPS